MNLTLSILAELMLLLSAFNLDGKINAKLIQACRLIRIVRIHIYKPHGIFRFRCPFLPHLKHAIYVNKTHLKFYSQSNICWRLHTTKY